jgi:hypothetical protein
VDLPQAVRDAADTSAITQLILKERESRDLGRWEDMRDVFTPIRRSASAGFAATAPTSSRDQSTWRAATCSPSAGSRPFASCSRGERAVATMSAVIEIPVELKGAAMNLLSYTRFVHRAERREGTWRIFSFDAIYLRDELTPAIPAIRSPSIRMSCGRFGRHTGSSLCLEQTGLRHRFRACRRRPPGLRWRPDARNFRLGTDEVRSGCERSRYGARALPVKPRGCFGVMVIADYWL